MTPDQTQRLAQLRHKGFGLPAARNLADIMERAERRRRARPAVPAPAPAQQRDESLTLGNVLACVAIVTIIILALLA